MTRVGRRGLILGPVTIKDGPSIPVNTVAPAIPASAVIGTALNVTPGTWTGSPVLTYQWQRNTGSWVNIGGATNTSYTPVDADFGRALRVVETADGSVSANSNETGLTAEAPVQSLGAELVVNGDFSAWTGDNPDGWTVTGETVSSPPFVSGAGVTEVGSGQDRNGAGTGACSVWKDGAFAITLSQSVATVGSWYEFGLDCSYITGYFVPFNITGFDAVGPRREMVRASNVNVGVTFSASAITREGTFDSFSAKLLTPNTQLTAPSANMRTDFYYTLPGSPIVLDAVYLLPRVSDFAAGNYWLAWLRYTGSQWDINLYSVASHTRTSRIAATNIGATDGMRINANADSWSLFTTTDGGSNWTQRGSTITNATYQTATGVNVLYTSSVTAGNLLYEPAT